MAEGINIGGWDVAFAMRYGDINNAIARTIIADRAAPPQSGTVVFPSDVNISSSDVTGVSTTVESSSISDWGLKAGGEGQNIVIGFAINGAKITIADGNPNTEDKIASNVIVNIEIEAKLVPQLDGSFTIGLRNTVGPIQPTYDLTGSAESLSSIQQTSINSVIINWVTGLLPAFDKLVTSIDASLSTNQADWTWMIPQVSEAVVNEPAGKDVDNFMVIIRSMTTQNAAPAVGSLSGNLIPDGATVGVVISPGLFLQKMLVGALSPLFDDAQDSDFVVSENRITTSKAFKISNFHPNAAETTPGDAVEAEFNNFEVELVGDHIQFKSDIRFPYKAINVATQFGSRMTLSLRTDTVSVTSTGQAVDLAMPDVQNTFTQTRNTVISASDTLNVASYLAMAAALLMGAAFAGSQVLAGEADEPVAGDTTTANGVTDTQLSDLSTQPDDLTAAEDDEASDTFSRSAAGEAPPRTFGHTRGYWLKTVGVGVMTVLTGGALAAVPAIIKDIQSGEVDEVNRDLTALLGEILKVLSLPEGTTEDYELVSIGIDGTLVIGAKMKA